MKYIFSFILLFIIFFVNASNAFAGDNTVYINDVDVAKKYAQEHNKELMLIFTADWCKYCEPLHDAIEANKELVDQKYVVCYVDYDKYKSLASKYKVGAIPATIIIKKDIVVKIIGYSNFNSYKQKIGL
jgi:thioredoxin 1